MTDMTSSPSGWRDFLAQQGAQFDAESGDITGFGPTAPTPQSLESFMAPLTSLGLITATGEDAASFLHGQLPNDVQQLDSSAARLA
ncbi:hypothetical protein ACSTJI_24630, partial [Vibrio parahaemolyticus]